MTGAGQNSEMSGGTRIAHEHWVSARFHFLASSESLSGIDSRQGERQARGTLPYAKQLRALLLAV
jgi:hypothetical protein